MQPNQEVSDESDSEENVDLEQRVVEQESIDQPANNKQPALATEKPQKSKKWLIVFVFLFIAVLAAGGYYYWRTTATNGGDSVAVNKRQNLNTNKQSPLIDKALTVFMNSTTGEKWLSAPKKISDQLNYYYDPDNTEYECTRATYYEVGSRGNHMIILAAIPGCIGGGISYLFERDKDGNVVYVAQPISNGDYTKYPSGDPVESTDIPLGKSVKVDKSIHYESLSPPKALPFGTNQFATVELNYPLIGELITTSVDSNVQETKVKQYGQASLQKFVRRYVDTKLSAMNYMLNLPTGTQKSVTYAPIPNDLSTYTWNNGVKVQKGDPAKIPYTTSVIAGVVRGCGAVMNSVTRVDDAKDSDFVVAGKTPKGQTVYAFKDNNNHVVKDVYKDYVAALDGASKPLSVEEIVKQHAIVAYKDTDGTWLVYNRDQFAFVGGCGKPVVYLYPTKTQNVNVRVSANVTVSDPTYNPATGWNALAQPNGQLTVNGRAYDSLFWEGTGSGLYPGITSGTVVKRADAVATIRSQLLQQGLNQKESNDFLAYWQNKIPDTPYVRLTWFNTAQMDQLAPLSVTPKPDTSLRVFLDMAGYDYPVTIPTQHFTQTERKGFTLVEWGGLINL